MAYCRSSSSWSEAHPSFTLVTGWLSLHKARPSRTVSVWQPGFVFKQRLALVLLILQRFYTLVPVLSCSLPWHGATRDFGHGGRLRPAMRSGTRRIGTCHKTAPTIRRHGCTISISSSEYPKELETLALIKKYSPQLTHPPFFLPPSPPLFMMIVHIPILLW